MLNDFTEPKVNVPSLQEAKDYIYSIDFSNVINKMVKHQGWLMKEALALCEVYRNFLYLNKKYCNHNNQLPPSEEIDEFWHNHILDTQKYRKDCQMIFGKYVDHYPYFGIDEKTNLNDLYDAFEKMKEFYMIEFGIELPKVTTRFSKVIALFKRKLTNIT